MFGRVHVLGLVKRQHDDGRVRGILRLEVDEVQNHLREEMSGELVAGNKVAVEERGRLPVLARQRTSIILVLHSRGDFVQQGGSVDRNAFAGLGRPHKGTVISAQLIGLAFHDRRGVVLFHKKTEFINAHSLRDQRQTRKYSGYTHIVILQDRRQRQLHGLTVQ